MRRRGSTGNWTTVIAAGLLILLLFPIGLGAAERPAVEVRTAFNTPVFNPGISFLWIGKELGYFREEGLEPSWVGTAGAAESSQWLSKGSVDFSTPPPSAVVSSAAKGIDLGITSPFLFNRLPIYSFAVKPDSPIRELRDLRGKRIGVPSLGDEAIWFIRATLEDQGFSGQDAALIAVGPVAQGGKALMSGDVDVLAHPDVQYGLMRALGFGLRFLPQPAFAHQIFGNGIWVRREYLKTHRDLVVRYCRAVAKGIIFFVTNPEATLHLHFKMFPETRPKGMSPEEGFRRSLIAIEARKDKLPPGPKQKWGEYSPADWNFYVRYIGVADKIKDPSPFYTNALIDEINSFDQGKIVEQARTFVLR